MGCPDSGSSSRARTRARSVERSARTPARLAERVAGGSLGRSEETRLRLPLERSDPAPVRSRGRARPGSSRSARSAAARPRARARRRSRSSGCPRRPHGAAARGPRAGRAATGSRSAHRRGGLPRPFDSPTAQPGGQGPPGLSSPPPRPMPRRAAGHACARGAGQRRPARPLEVRLEQRAGVHMSTRRGRPRSRSTSAPARSSTRATPTSRSSPPRTRSSRSPTRRWRSSGPATASTPRSSAAAGSSATSGTATSGCGASATPPSSRPTSTGWRRRSPPGGSGVSTAQSLRTNPGSTRAGRRPAGGPSFYIYESPPLSALAVDRGWYRGRTSTSPALAAGSLLRRSARGGGRHGARPNARRRAHDVRPAAGAGSSPSGWRTLVRFMGSESDNYTAELLVKQLGGDTTPASGSTAAGTRVIRDALGDAGVPLGGVRLADGSGLSGLDRLTAAAVVALLEAGLADAELRDPVPPVARRGRGQRHARGSDATSAPPAGA